MKKFLEIIKLLLSLLKKSEGERPVSDIDQDKSEELPVEVTSFPLPEKEESQMLNDEQIKEMIRHIRHI